MNGDDQPVAGLPQLLFQVLDPRLGERVAPGRHSHFARKDGAVAGCDVDCPAWQLDENTATENTEHTQRKIKKRKQ